MYVDSRADELTGSFAPNDTVTRGRYRSSHSLDPRRLSSVRLAVPLVAARRGSAGSGRFNQL